MGHDYIGQSSLAISHVYRHMCGYVYRHVCWHVDGHAFKDVCGHVHGHVHTYVNRHVTKSSGGSILVLAASPKSLATPVSGDGH